MATARPRSTCADGGDTLVAARACTPGSPDACAALVDSSLATSACGCDAVYVNDSTDLKAIQQTWLSMRCQPPRMNCPSCGAVAPAECVQGDAGGGVCRPGS